MSKVTVKWNESAIAKIKGDVQTGLLKMGLEVASRARAGAPVDTGALKGSIRVQAEGTNRVRVIAGGGAVNYAAYQEFGTKYIEGRHYMENALNGAWNSNWSRFFKV